MQIYNTLTRQQEDFKPVDGKQVRMYVCGITPYDSAHIGHAMSYLVFDTIRRYLEYTGYNVKHVQNFTDIDDKIITRAQQRGVTAQALAERYIGEFMEDMALLNVQPAHVYPRATQEVEGIITLIQGLIDKGFAYPSNGDVYFRVERLPDYGKLSHRGLEDMRAGARVEVDEQKEHPMDFALWKAAKPGEPSWPSPWGEGRPGWHIECSAMSLRYLGEQIDIHGGGQDLIFPHHENEIAQTESFTGQKPFVRYWLHNGLLQLGGEKMSKSLGNLITIKDAVAEHGADALRLFVLTSHYRSPLTYTDESIEAAKRGVARLRAAVSAPVPEGPAASDQTAADLAEATARARLSFTVGMEDDFNTPAAVAALFDLARDLNRGREAGAGAEAVERAQKTLAELAGVLGFTLAEAQSEEAVAAGPFVDLLLRIRQDLRQAKQWALADKVRDELAALGVVVEDRPGGSAWKMKK